MPLEDARFRKLNDYYDLFSNMFGAIGEQHGEDDGAPAFLLHMFSRSVGHMKRTHNVDFKHLEEFRRRDLFPIAGRMDCREVTQRVQITEFFNGLPDRAAAGIERAYIDIERD